MGYNLTCHLRRQSQLQVNLKRAPFAKTDTQRALSLISLCKSFCRFLILPFYCFVVLSSYYFITYLNALNATAIGFRQSSVCVQTRYSRCSLFLFFYHYNSLSLSLALFLTISPSISIFLTALLPILFLPAHIQHPIRVGNLVSMHFHCSPAPFHAPFSLAVSLLLFAFNLILTDL